MEYGGSEHERVSLLWSQKSSRDGAIRPFMLEPQLGTSIEEVGALPIWSKIPKIPVWEKMENAFFSVCPTRKLEKKKKVELRKR